MKAKDRRGTFTKRAAAWIPAILLMIAIFYFSSQPAEVSGNLSGGIAYRLVRMASDAAGLGWSEARQQLLAERLDYPLRKLAHMTEYAMLGMAVAFGVAYGSGEGQDRRGGGSAKARYAWTQLIGSLYAASDEFHQLFVPGRAGLASDVLIDSIGVFIGWWAFVIFCKLFRMQGRIFAR